MNHSNPVQNRTFKNEDDYQTPYPTTELRFRSNAGNQEDSEFHTATTMLPNPLIPTGNSTNDNVETLQFSNTLLREVHKQNFISDLTSGSSSLSYQHLDSKKGPTPPMIVRYPYKKKSGSDEDEVEFNDYKEKEFYDQEINPPDLSSTILLMGSTLLTFGLTKWAIPWLDKTVNHKNQPTIVINSDKDKYSKCITNKQDVETLYKVLNENISVNTKLSDGNPAIITVANNCLLNYIGSSLIKQLLNKDGTEINAVSVEGASLFMITVTTSISIAQMLEKEANGQRINWSYINPNDKLSNIGYVDKMLFQLMNKTNISSDTVGALFDTGVDVNLLSFKGENIVINLAKTGDANNIIELALKHGADVNTISQGKSAMMYAFENNNFAIAHLLLQQPQLNLQYKNVDNVTNQDYLKSFCKSADPHNIAYFHDVVDCTKFPSD